MASQELMQQLLGLPDLNAQKRFLDEHTSLLDDELANELKEQASRFLRSDVQRSSQTAELLLYLSELTDNPLHRALGLLAEANACCLGGLGEFHKAIELYNTAADIYQANDRPAEKARSQIGKLYALALLGRYQEALETGEWASRVLEAHAQWRHLATLTLNLGLIHSRMGDDAQALVLFERTGDIYRRMGKEGDRFLPWVDQNRAIALRNLGQYEASIQASQSAVEMLTGLGQSAEVARARQNLAVTYFVLGRYNEALKLLDQVRDVFYADGRQRDAVLVELFITDCLLQLRRLSDVLDKCGQIRGLFTELGTRSEVAQALLNEAAAYAGLHHYQQAEASLAEARRLFTEQGSQVWTACADLELAALLLRQGRCDESLTTAQACADVFQAHSLPFREAQSVLVAARAAFALDRCDQALQLVNQALAVGQSKDIPSLTYQGHQLLGALSETEGGFHEALVAYERALQELERLRGRLMVEFRADFLEDKAAIYEDSVRMCLELDRPLQALECAERAKSRALLDLLAYRLDLSIQARDEADQPLVEELMCLRAERNGVYRRWESDPESGERGWTQAEGARHRAQQDVLALEKQITELWHRLLIRNADYARQAALWTVRTEPIQPYLEPDTLLVEYFAVRGKPVVFLVTREEVQVRSLSRDLSHIKTWLGMLWLNLRAASKADRGRLSDLAANAQGVLRRLHEALVAPLEETFTTYPKLIFVPHGPLHYLPFHALHDGRSFLLERHEISYLPGASLLRYCRETQPAATGLLALGHSCHGRLPYTLGEARAVAALWGGQAYLEQEATLARLRDAAPDCRVLHLATHGEFRADNPLFSGLVLEDGWLTTLEIFNLRLRASLVTLSACQTGRNVVGGGDELLGLMRALLHAGAASLVVSLWAVEDRSTARLMEAFYRKLAQGWDKGAALRHAQRWVLEEMGRNESPAGGYAHPYYWAPFCLVGDAGPL